MVDDQIVNEGEVSTEGTASTEETPEQEQPLTREQVQQLIAEQTEIAKEIGRREMQGIKDREVAEAQRRARGAEGTLARVRSQYGNLDPEVRQTLETEELRARVGHYQSQEADDALYQQAMATVNVFEGNLAQFITDMGIDPNDKRINWGDRNSMNLAQRQDIVLKSVTKIHKENTKTAEGKRSQDSKDMEARLRKDLGLDSVDTSASASAGGEENEAQRLKKRYPNM